MANSTASSAPARPLGYETPRLWTKPLRKLTPNTTLGFECIDFATDVLGWVLMPHQRWVLIHALEVVGPISERNLRFRLILILIGRQCGKTTLMKLINLFFMYTGMARLILGAAQNLDIAREAWQGTVEICEDDAELRVHIAPNGIRRTNGEQCLTLANRARYKITAASRSAGRGLAVDLLDWDELREQRDWQAWAALSKTTNARPNGLILAISNAGDDESVVLNTLRDAAFSQIDSGTTTGLFEYSAEPGCALDDWEAIAQGSPALGYPQGIPYAAVESALANDPAVIFRTEILCQKVDSLDTPITPYAWESCADPDMESIVGAKQKHFCLDVSIDGAHATLAAAASGDDGRVKVGIVAAWDATDGLRVAMPDLLKEYKPKTLGWFPNGPAAALMADVKALSGVKKTELKSNEVSAACQGLADLVKARLLTHPNDPLLTAHVTGSHKLVSGDGWRFSRKGGHADAAYAAAGAVHLSRIATRTRSVHIVVSKTG